MTVVSDAGKVVSVTPLAKSVGVCSLGAYRLEFGCLVIAPRQTPKLYTCNMVSFKFTAEQQELVMHHSYIQKQ